MLWDAKAYHVVSNPQLSWGLAVLDGVQLAGDERVVDVGCGTGRVTAALGERVPRGEIIAVDPDPGMIDEAKKTLARFGDRVRTIVASGTELPPLAADLVFSTATFHWIPDHDALFRSIFAALKSGGRLVAQCGGRGNLTRILARLAVILREPAIARCFIGVAEPWFYAGPEDTAARLRAAGFVDVETSLTGAPTEFPSREAFRMFIDSVILRQRLAPLGDSALRTEVVDRLTDEASRDDPPFTLDYVRLNLRARRPST